MISVITPCYNSEEFIQKCIENVASSSINGLEHLIIDGGSTDQTAIIAKSLANKYSHISVFSESDTGQSQAMNRGILKAKNRAITFLNVDDEFCHGTLEYVAKLIPQQPDLFFIVGNCQLRDLDGNNLSINKPSCISYQKLLLFSRKYPYPANPSSYFYDKKIHQVVGFYDENLHYTMDLEFILRMSRVATVVYKNKTFGYFTLHSGGKTSASRKAKAEIKSWSTIYKKKLSFKSLINYYANKSILSMHEIIWLLNSYTCRAYRKLVYYLKMLNISKLT